MGYQEIKLELLKLPKLNLKLVFFAHFVLISWATLGNWALNAYLVHNILLLTCLVWSIAIPESEEPIFLSLGINLVSVLFDIIILSIYYPRYDLSGLSKNKTAEFSAVIAIFNLLFRFVSSHILYTEWGDRGGMLSMQTKARPVNHSTTQGGSVRSGSVLAHYPGQFEGQVLQSPPTPEKASLPPALPPPTYVANS
eukprot:TRINITY_DN6479_c0_g1_i1.p1 TRINITY_DN6479_c0_g1~~TRINITY_DN6479_c0_g1_i1.p1  ORF type:complete len:196 (-),score=49.39 TRINITY_DN6479_c0_g1_i1:161-748(-)